MYKITMKKCDFALINSTDVNITDVNIIIKKTALLYSNSAVLICKGQKKLLNFYKLLNKFL